MPVMDEFKEERQALKNGTLKQKLAYFWDYYKLHLIIVIIVVASAVSIVHQAVTKRDTALYALFLNGSTNDFLADESLNTAAFAEYAGIDEEEYQILYDTSVHIGDGAADEYTSVQKLMVYIASEELDVIVSDPDSMQLYAYQGDFQDLREFLSPEQLNRYADSFYYMDQAVADEHAAANEANDYDYVPVYGDPHHPEEMQNPIPTGIFLPSDCPLLKDYSFRGDEIAVSVLINTQRPEAASKYIDFLMQVKQD